MNAYYFLTSKSSDNSDWISFLIKTIFFNKLTDYHETQYTRYATGSHPDSLRLVFHNQ